MAATAIFVHKSIGYREFLHSSALSAEMQRRADAVAAAARSAAPVDSGAYRSSIAATVVSHPSRVVGRVTADLPYAGVVEAKTGNLARALDAAAG